MGQGHIIGPRRTKNRGNAWLLKFDVGAAIGSSHRETRYKTVHCHTKAEARAELRRILSQIDRGSFVDLRKTTVNEWIVQWMGIIEPDVSAKTFERYCELLRLHVIPSLGYIPLQKLTGVQIQALYAKLRIDGRLSPIQRKSGDSEAKDLEPNRRISKGLSATTTLHVHRVLSQCLKEAVRKRIISRSPTEDVRAPRPSCSTSIENSEEGNGERMRALDTNELQRLLANFREDSLFPIVSVAAGTGMRRGEILALRWSDLDFERRTLRIERSLEETNSKGVRFKVPKNKSSKRTIGINERLVGLLRKHWKQQVENSLRLGFHLPTDALIFPGSPTEPRIPHAPRYLSKTFIKKANEFGFRGFRFHDLRHTHATLLLTASVPINAVAQRLGHSSPVVTLTVYGHVLRRSEDHAVTVTEEIMKVALE